MLAEPSLFFAVPGYGSRIYPSGVLSAVRAYSQRGSKSEIRGNKLVDDLDEANRVSETLLTGPKATAAPIAVVYDCLALAAECYQKRARFSYAGSNVDGDESISRV